MVLLNCMYIQSNLEGHLQRHFSRPNYRECSVAPLTVSETSPKILIYHFSMTSLDRNTMARGSTVVGNMLPLLDILAMA